MRARQHLAFSLIAVIFGLCAVAGPARAAGPLVAVPPQIVFPDAGNGMVPQPQKVTLTNVGMGQATVSNVIITGPNAGDFILDFGVFQPPFAIGPGVSLTVTIRFSPQALGLRSAALTLQVAGGLGDTIVPLSGKAVPNAPIIKVNPAFVDFGLIGVLAKRTIQVTISNTGLAALNFKDFRLIDPMLCACMKVNNAPMPDMNGVWPQIPAGGMMTLDVLCSPQIEAIFNAEIDIDSDDANNPHLKIPMVCNGAQAPLKVNPVTIDFGTVLVGDNSRPENVTITNTGGAELTINSVSLTGQSPNSYHIDDPGMFTLAAKQSKVIPVDCAPVSLGDLPASLVITPAGFAAAQVKLSCTGAKRLIQIGSDQDDPSTANFDKLGATFVGGWAGPILVGVKVPSIGFSLAISEVRVDNPAFRIDTSETAFKALSPGQVTQFSVFFEPTTKGLAQGTISVFVTGEPMALATLPVRGTASDNSPIGINDGVDCSIGGHRAGRGLGILIAIAALGLLVTHRRGRRRRARHLALTLAILCALGGPAAAAGPLVAVPPQVVFGMPPAPVMVTFTNNGMGPITITSIVLGAGMGGGGNPADFMVDPGPFAPPMVLGPGVSFTISVKFDGAPGMHTAVLSALLAGGLGQTDVPLSGVGLAPGPAIKVDPAIVDFGTLSVLSKGVKTVTISNTGKDVLNLKDFRFLDPKACGCWQVNNAPMPGMNGNWPVLKPTEKLTFLVMCSPQVDGMFKAEIDIDSDDATTPHVVLPLLCNSALASIKVDPVSMNFGTVLVGQVSPLENVTITNTGGAEQTINTVSLNGSAANSFHFDNPGKFTLAGGQSKVIPIDCAPASLGDLSASLVINPAGFAFVQVKLSCVGAKRLIQIGSNQDDPSTANFDKLGATLVGGQSGEILVGVTVPKSSLPITISEVRVDNPAFRIDTSKTVFKELPPGLWTSFGVFFDPTVKGLTQGTISVFVTGEPMALATLPVRGTASEIAPIDTDSGSDCSIGRHRSGRGLGILIGFAALGLLVTRRRWPRRRLGNR